MTGELGAVIVAAGAGRRLGGVAKALLMSDGRTYLAAIATAAREVGLAGAVVVVGPPFGDAVAAHARALGLAVAINPTPERGMASSIACGFAALGARDPDRRLAAAWLWPVDHPAVTAATLRALCAAAATTDAAWIQPRHRGAGGHPPLIRRALWPALAAGSDAAEGARGVLRGAPVCAVEVDDPGVVRDVDTLVDLEVQA